MKRGNELQVEEYFRKRIEKRSVKLKTSNTNSRKLQTFRSSRKVWTFCGKDNPDDTGRYLAKASKILYPCNSLLRHSNFLNLARQQTALRHFQRAVDWIFVLQSLLEVSGKGQVRRYVDEVWTFASFVTAVAIKKFATSRDIGSKSQICDVV